MIIGEVLSRTEVGGVIYQPSIVADGMLYVLNNEGRLTAFR